MDQNIAKKAIERYKELEVLARETFMQDIGNGIRSGRYNEPELQERIRTMAVIREVIETEESRSKSFPANTLS